MESRWVFVIDDDPAMLRSTAFALRALGYRCEGFADAGAFLDSIERLEPGCILTDLRMPGIEGEQVGQALVQASVSWPMILMSSDIGFNAGDARDSGFAAFLRKPFSGDELAAALEGCSRAEDGER